MPHPSILKRPFALLVAAALLVLAQAVPAQDMVSVDRTSVNMRSGASTQHAVLWELAKGYPLEVTSRKGSWLRVRDFENDRGWVYRPMVGNTAHMIVKARIANVRSAPTTRSRILGKAEYGEVLRTMEHRARWVKVQRESGIKGWVSRGLVWGW